MSDGASDGYRSAREHEARQKTIDTFFEMVLVHVLGGRFTSAKAFRKAFDDFDAHRYNDTLLHGRIQKDRGKRWEAFQALLHDVSGTRTDTAVIKAWAEILTLSLRFASGKVTEDLRDVSVFKQYRIALYVPNGTGFYGKNSPTLLGDFAAALDAMAVPIGVTPDAHVIIIDDAPRAVVGVTLGPDGGENLEPERAKLRFLAVKVP